MDKKAMCFLKQVYTSHHVLLISVSKFNKEASNQEKCQSYAHFLETSASPEMLEARGPKSGIRRTILPMKSPKEDPSLFW